MGECCGFYWEGFQFPSQRWHAQRELCLGSCRAGHQLLPSSSSHAASPPLLCVPATMVIFRPLTIPCFFLPQGVSIIWNIFFCTLSILIPTWNEISLPSPGLISCVRSTHAAACTSPHSFSHNFNSITVSFPIPSLESKFHWCITRI